MKLKNPVLTGFNADPSIIRVADTYYIATSTFEWFPGVRIHTSKDLINWQLVAHPLSTVDLLDMRGNPASGGIWAPDLSYCDGTFWLVYPVAFFWNNVNSYLVKPWVKGVQTTP